MADIRPMQEASEALDGMVPRPSRFHTVTHECHLALNPLRV